MGLKEAVMESSVIEKKNASSPLADVMDPQRVAEERILQIPASQIRTNALNFYDRSGAEYSEAERNNENELVAGLADVLMKRGQDSPAIVYADDTPRDGRNYTLIAGSRRLKAVQLNESRGGDGLLLCKVVSKPENRDIEILRIIQNNGIRSKDKKVRLQEVAELSKVYETLRASGERPTGRKVEWIGSQVGLCSRQVGRYLKEITEIDGVLQEPRDSQQSESADIQLTKEDKQRMKQKAVALSQDLGLPVKINSNFSIVITPPTRDEIGLDNLIRQMRGLLKTGGQS